MKFYLTTDEAARRLNCARITVQKMCQHGRLPCIKQGRDYLIDPVDIKGVKVMSKPGRPKKGK